MAGSSTTLDVSASIQDLKFMHVSNVNVSNFVSVKLSGRSNYKIWKAQMLCLIKSQGLLHFIDAAYPLQHDLDVQMNVQYDELVKGWIFGSMQEQLLEDSVHFNSASDLWKDLEGFLWDINDFREDPSEFIFQKDLLTYPLVLDNIGETAGKRLYEAAVEGCWWKAKSILKVHKHVATKAIKENGDTILHIAVEMGQNYFVEKLLEFLKNGKDIETENFNGRTALHIAALVDNAHAAQLLVQKRRILLVIRDHYSETPFDIAFSNMKFNTSAYFLKYTATFYRISLHVNQDTATNAMVAAIFTKQYDLAERFLIEFPDVARTKKDILFMLVITFPTDLGFMESVIYPSFHDVCQRTVGRVSLLFHSNFWDKCVDDILWAVKIPNNKCCSWLGSISMILLVPIATLYPIYQLIYLLILVLRLTLSMLYFLMWKILAVTVLPIKNVEKKKKTYMEANRVLSLICDLMGTSNNGYSTSIIEAVERGTYEVVDEILFRAPSIINCKDQNGYNIIQLAIINRSEKIYNLLYHIIKRSKSYIQMVDSSGNNLAHLAGSLAPSVVLGRTTGAALQLQRELLWREELEKIMLPLYLIEKNINEETPAMIFTREHRDLMKQGEGWMKTTAESCSITAALIVTVVFAAAITVPGGSNQESGVPVFKKEIAFTIFAVSNAFSLFTAATALLLFLSILTARFSERDFLANLPKRLIFGLVTLFLSTTAMIVAFGAILFLVFCDQRPWMLVPIFGFACLPISVMVTIKLPLLVDFIQSTYFPILGKQSSVESCKVNPKSTIFMD